uniref:Carboxylesterase type B domain-containing protein n=1 Tax=Anopheles christyi TaxID=43041 RepID=A0A182K2F0_9DIPT
MAEGKITVSIQPGNIVGLKGALPNGTDWYVFKGIPYAQPPVGPLRFKPPVPLDTLPTDPLECFIDGPSCYSEDVRFQRMSEDCLYLNVYSPQLHPKTPLPVMVWIHGGGFYSGTGDSALYEPPYLVQQGAVVVCINYRLGPLGFLSLPSAGIDGNMGLKDQRMSLRWVQENIANFGGDPNNVTLFGESAGGASVHLHYLSEASRVFFHKAIAQSGTAFNEWLWQREPVERARKLAQLLGASDESDETVLATLMSASAEKMTAIQNQCMSERDQTMLVRFPFTPVIEEDGAVDAIITEHPSRAAEKVFRKEIPLMLGSTNNEGLVLWGFVKEKLPLFQTDPTRFIPATLDVHSEEDKRNASEAIQKFFFNDRPISLETIRIITTILGDNVNTFPGYIATGLHARFQSAPLYMYVFSHMGELNMYRKEFKIPPEEIGVCHADELYYLFSSSIYNTAAVQDHTECGRFREYFCNLWVNFARFGNPHATIVDWVPVERVTKENEKRFYPAAMNLKDIGECKMTTEFFYERYQFWKNLYQKFNGSHLLPKVSNRTNVDLKCGTVCGIVEKLPDGNDFYAFRGIPYAQPPVNKHRFQPPIPITKFAAPLLDCSKERDTCVAKNPFNQQWQGSENCLHLNVYTPQLNRNATPLPVMVFIHGGAFKYGSGNSDCYSPEYLLEQNVVVVTFNYRLGPLGFLHLPSQGIEGNAALKDQLLVLRWVAENITHFNGDPNNVTLFGESAGAISVHLHLLSPVSTKLFHKAICESSVALADYAVPNDTLGNSRRLAQLINPSANTDPEMLETLLSAPAKQLAELCDRTATGQEKRGAILMPFRPVVDVSGKEVIVPLHPIKAMGTARRIPPIPLLLGYNSREGGSFLTHIVKYPERYREDMERIIPRTLNVKHGTPEARELARRIESFYFGSEGYSPRKVNECADLMSDFSFAILMRATAEMHARYQHRSPLYFYRFEYDGLLNQYKKFLPFPISGAYHADELGYLFRMRMLPKEVHPQSDEARVRRYMCRMWTNFARYGDPTPLHDESLPYRWTPVPPMEPDSTAPFHLPYLRINDEPEMAVDPDKERIDFWKKIYDEFNGGLHNPVYKL